MSNTYKTMPYEFRKSHSYEVWWGRKAGYGKFWKKRWHKVCRRWQDTHERGISNLRSEINWKGW